MVGLWRRLIKSEPGQALPLVLIFLLFGGVIIAGSIGYVDVMLRGTQSIEKGNLACYAADAGIEDVIWSLKNGTTPRTSLPQNINGMQVTMSTVSKGNYTLLAGDWVSAASHSSDLLISSNIVWDAGANAYKYTITCTWSGPGNCSITQVGAKLPFGYNYKAGSAALFSSNLSTGEPSNQLDGNGARKLNWSFSSTTLSPTKTEIFHFTGSGALENEYAWAVAQRADVGYAGELIGAFYVITANAIINSQVVTTIVADVMKSTSAVSITSWRINPF